MARPREFDEAAVLDAAMDRFWRHGYEATSVRDLADEMNIAGAGARCVLAQGSARRDHAGFGRGNRRSARQPLQCLR